VKILQVLTHSKANTHWPASQIAMLISAILLASCASTPPSAAVKSAELSSLLRDQWQTVSLRDHKMGYRHIRRELNSERINSTETLALTLSQPGTRDRKISTILSYQESIDGKAISLSKTMTSETANHQMNAKVSGNTLVVTLKQDAKAEKYAIPEPFYLPEGLRLALLKHEPRDALLTYYSWNFSTRSFDKISLTIKAYTDSANPAYAWHIQKATAIGESSKTSDIFTDAHFYPLTERSHSNGGDVLFASCDRACATADFIPNTHVYRQLIQSPYRISDSALQGKIRYHLSGDFDLQPPTTYEQSVAVSPEGTELVVCGDCGTESSPSDDDLNTALKDNYWLPAQNPIFKNLVAELLPDQDSDPSGQMQRLTRFVTRHMSDEPSYSGYATALEAFNSQQGDCTEHALLLATLARAANIPTRVVFGLAYNNERFLGRKYVFVPHAWVQAWTGSKWESFDSGLGDFTAGYIALGLSNGDQSDILKINEQLHKILIASAIQIRRR
tara:strand:+ start:642 stop:2150 length:1509 start_codon:yes stop_codon:yes gene_type:complete